MNCSKPRVVFALFAPLLLCACQFFTPSPEDVATPDACAQTSGQTDGTTPATAPVKPVVAPEATPAIAPGKPGYIKQQAKIGEKMLAVKAQLDTFAKGHVSRANATLKPSRAQIAVTKEKGMYIARFLEVDPDTLTTEIYASTAPGCAYVGHVVYLEKVYEATGETRMKAETGTFKQVRARRIREITRYSKGAWVY